MDNRQLLVNRQQQFLLYIHVNDSGEVSLGLILQRKLYIRNCKVNIKGIFENDMVEIAGDARLLCYSRSEWC